MTRSDFVLVHGRIHTPQRSLRLDRLGVCRAKADAERVDRARDSTPLDGIINFEYNFRIGDVRCLTVVKSCLRLGTRSRFTARHSCDSGSRCTRRTGEPNQRPAVLVVRCCRSRNEQFHARTAVCYGYDSIDAAVSARAS